MRRLRGRRGAATGRSEDKGLIVAAYVMTRLTSWPAMRLGQAWNLNHTTCVKHDGTVQGPLRRGVRL